MPCRILVIAESIADQRLACGLIDRKILHHAPEWLDRDQLEHERVWTGIEAGETFTPWKRLRALTGDEFGWRRLRAIGHRGGPERRFDYPATRKVLLFCTQMTPTPDAVLLVRDLDKQPVQRKKSIETARSEIAATGARVVLALPNPKREAWVLNGFDCSNAVEEEALAALKNALGFDPRLEAERLDAETHGAARDSKRVLAVLTKDSEREERCWQETSWKVLRTRGVATGLALFLEEVSQVLVPLVTGPRR